MIRLERDPAFWRDIASHPAVAGAVMGLDPDAVAAAAQRPSQLPLASDNGGFLFGQMDALGLVRELHTLYRPAGWGREVAGAAKEAFEWVFSAAQVVVTHELENNPHSRPPRSFGFTPAGEWQATVIGPLRAWVLTRAAWEASPAHGRMLKCRRSLQ
ncbi:MAG: hypothetical protein ACR2F8_04070 [Caulobacteraceae bacterium]